MFTRHRNTLGKNEPSLFSCKELLSDSGQPSSVFYVRELAACFNGQPQLTDTFFIASVENSILDHASSTTPPNNRISTRNCPTTVLS
jgi:hypothetical protein